MVLRDADRVVAAGDGGAGVDTGGGLARQQSGAVPVIGALHSGWRPNTASKVGVTLGTLGTLALVTSVLIYTPDIKNSSKFVLLCKVLHFVFVKQMRK